MHPVGTILKTKDDTPHSLKIGAKAIIKPHPNKECNGGYLATTFDGKSDLIWPEEVMFLDDGEDPFRVKTTSTKRN